mmetsp:Transcript_21258/g.24473  ORF Transcript_21258/g.24473 Transcript_21258/m.24473 type:complete len:196 (+) Transcript_21258:240-827(+)
MLISKIIGSSQRLRYVGRTLKINAINRNSLQTKNTNVVTFSQKRYLSEFGYGTDLLNESLHHTIRPKIVFDSYSATSGCDVRGMEAAKGSVVHMNGSCIGFPHACYLWKPSNPKEITMDSLEVITIHEPSIDILLVGSDTPIPPRLMNKIREGMRESGIVVDHMDLLHACATFNVLNGEDRNVAVALLCEDADED